MSSSAKAAEAQRISLITPWRVRCGIATFSEQLAQGYAHHGREVYVSVLSRFSEKQPIYYNWLVSRAPDVDVFVVQHEYGLYLGNEGSLYDTIGDRKTPVVTEMHSTGNYNVDPGILARSDRVIVHNDYCAGRLPRNDKTVVIPHPVPMPKRIMGRDEARRELKLPLDKKIVLVFGFITPAKGHDVAVRAVAKMPDDVLLAIAGGWHTDENTPFISEVSGLAGRLLGKRALWLGYVPNDKMPATFGAADVILMAYKQATESGAFMTAIAHHKAVVASRLPNFAEKERHGIVKVFQEEEDLPGILQGILDDDEERLRMEGAAARFAGENSYARIAARHLELFDSLVSSG